jgi:hypothetical protein
MTNGEMRERKYLIYSPSKKAVFCIPCRLFAGKAGAGESKLATTGYTDWRNIESGLQGHENSPEHRRCQLTFLQRSKSLSRIDAELQHPIQIEVNQGRIYAQAT